MSSRRCFAGSGGLSCVYAPRAQTHERSVPWQQTDSTLEDYQRLHCQQNKQKTWNLIPLGRTAGARTGSNLAARPLQPIYLDDLETQRLSGYQVVVFLDTCQKPCVCALSHACGSPHAPPLVCQVHTRVHPLV